MSDDWTPRPRHVPQPGMVLDLSSTTATLVVPEELAHAAAVLQRAAELLGEAVALLHLAGLDPRRLPDLVGEGRLWWDQARAVAAAGRIEELSVRTAHAAVCYAGADTSGVQLAGAIGGSIGDHPLLLPIAAGVALSGLATLFGAELAASVVRGEQDPLGKATTRTSGELTQDGRAAIAAGFAAGLLRGLLPGWDPRGVDLPATSAALSHLTGDPPPAVTVPVDDAPQLKPPTGLADVVTAVDEAYDVQGRTGAVLVQRLTHADGSTSWLVAIPGTQSFGLGGDTVTDMSTNLALAGGLPDQMTTGVLDAMRQAGIGPTDPVLVSGHSQGGMTAQAVAVAAGSAYSIRAVVAIGSPTIPAAMPPGVGLSAIAEHEEAITGVDGAPGVALHRDQLVVYGDLSSELHDVPGPSSAHDRENYRALAARADAQLAEQGRQAPGVADVLDGVVSTETMAFQVTRDPAAVAAGSS